MQRDGRMEWDRRRRIGTRPQGQTEYQKMDFQFNDVRRSLGQRKNTTRPSQEVRGDINSVLSRESSGRNYFRPHNPESSMINDQR